MSYYLNENGTDRILLEDSSGLLLIEDNFIQFRRTLADYIRVGSRVMRIIIISAALLCF